MEKVQVWAAALSITGLVVTSVSAIGLLRGEITERVKRADRTQKVVNLRYRVGVYNKILRETLDNVADVNAKLGHQAYSADQESAYTRTHIEKLKKELDELEASDQQFIEELPSAFQLKALVGLALGFIIQLIGEVLKLG